MPKTSFINWENAPIGKEGFIAIFIFMTGLIGEGVYFYNRFITLETDMLEANNKIVGVHILGPHASDLIHEAALIISQGLGVKDVSKVIHAHPTLAEAFVEAVLGLHNEAIHQVPKKK